ncbi:MAG: DUF3592 domain-containing protein [Faecalibacterium sp.]
MSFEAMFMFAGVLILGFTGLKRYKTYQEILKECEKTPATIVGTGENRTTGRYYLVSFQTEGGTHQLPYPVPKKGDLFMIGQNVTLYYDINNLEKLFIEEDKSEMQGITFYFSIAIMLFVFTVLLW